MWKEKHQKGRIAITGPKATLIEPIYVVVKIKASLSFYWCQDKVEDGRQSLSPFPSLLYETMGTP